MDYNALGKLIERQIAQGVNGIILCGTTGESPTLTEDEKLKIFEFGVKEFSGKATIVAGTGSNNTAGSVELSKKACDLGVDGLLLVTPYYNKPSQEGLFLHYEKIATSVSKPCCLYNVPGRTGVSLTPDTVARLAVLDNVLAIKEASADMELIRKMKEKTNGELDILSGDDGTYLSALENGACGVVSVVTNVLPGQFVQMLEKFHAGDLEGAKAINTHLKKLMETLFIESNPVPVKLFLHLMGLVQYQYRLPLCPAAMSTFETVKKVCEEYELI